MSRYRAIFHVEDFAGHIRNFQSNGAVNAELDFSPDFDWQKFGPFMESSGGLRI